MSQKVSGVALGRNGSLKTGRMQFEGSGRGGQRTIPARLSQGGARSRTARRGANAGGRMMILAAMETSEGESIKVIIAGGGIGGLMCARALQTKGIPVEVYERTREYRPFGGPIQLAGNALSAIEAIDGDLAQKIMDNGVITGDRVNGLLDGKTGTWYCRFDTRKPAFKNGVPLTQVIGRYKLQELLVESVGANVIHNGSKVVSYEDHGEDGLSATLSDGTVVKGDILIGADGIRSDVRQQIRRQKDEPQYSGYTCYTGICAYDSEDVEKIGYQVFLGSNQYFVCSDVGNGLSQWYAFYNQPSGMDDSNVDKKQVLQELFGDWCQAVRDRIDSTPQEEIERRDIYDMTPTMNWVEGRVALLGDAAHAMQPNMGQGGCQAIEDAHMLMHELSSLPNQPSAKQISEALEKYAESRRMRAAAVMGFARMAALMACTYRPYLGSSPYKFYEKIPGMIPFWRAVEKLKIPHPGRVVGQIMMMVSIDIILEYITGGGKIQQSERAPYCQVPGISIPKRSVSDDDFRMKGIPGIAQ